MRIIVIIIIFLTPSQVIADIHYCQGILKIINPSKGIYGDTDKNNLIVELVIKQTGKVWEGYIDGKNFSIRCFKGTDLTKLLVRIADTRQKETDGQLSLTFSEAGVAGELQENRGRTDMFNCIFHHIYLSLKSVDNPDVDKLWSILANKWETTSIFATPINQINSHQYDKISQLLENSLELMESNIYKNSDYTLTALYVLSRIYTASGDNVKVEDTYKKLINLKEKFFGPYHPSIAPDLDNLAELYKTINRLKDIEPLYERSLMIKEKELGHDNMDVAEALINLAEFYRSIGYIIKAEPLFKQALRIQEKICGYYSPALLGALNGLAGIYMISYRYDEAMPLYKVILSIQEKKFGIQSDDVADTLFHLASVYYFSEQYTESEAIFRHAHEIIVKNNKYNPAKISASMNTLGEFFESTHRYAEAESFYNEALAIRKDIFQNDHPLISVSMCNLASVNDSTGNRNESSYLFRQAFLLAKRNGNINGLYLVLTGLSRHLEKMGNIGAAVFFDKLALKAAQTDSTGRVQLDDGCIKRYGNSIQSVYNHLIQLLRHQERNFEAEQILKLSNELGQMDPIEMNLHVSSITKPIFFSSFEKIQDRRLQEIGNKITNLVSRCGVYEKKAHWCQVDESVYKKLENKLDTEIVAFSTILDHVIKDFMIEK